MICSQPWNCVFLDRIYALPCCYTPRTDEFAGESLNAYMNAPLSVAARETMKSGKFPATCSGCRNTTSGAMLTEKAQFYDSAVGLWDEKRWSRFNEGRLSAEFLENLARSAEHWKQRDVMLTTTPLMVSVGFDLNCNLRCSFCRQRGAPTSNAGRIAVAAMILREHMKLGVVYASGGEPFYSPMMGAFLRECAERRPHFDLTMNTNGLLIDMRLIQRLKIAYIGVSLSAATADTYERVHGGDFAKVNAALEALVAAWKKNGNPRDVYTDFVVTLWNRHELPEAIRRNLALGIRTRVVKGGVPANMDILQGPDEEKQKTLGIIDEALAIPDIHEFTRVCARSLRDVVAASRKVAA